MAKKEFTILNKLGIPTDAYIAVEEVKDVRHPIHCVAICRICTVFMSGIDLVLMLYGITLILRC